MVSKTSGLLFERRLIEKALAARPSLSPHARSHALPLLRRSTLLALLFSSSMCSQLSLSAPRAAQQPLQTAKQALTRARPQETGECPVTRSPLSLDDLVAVKTNKARLSAHTAPPTLITVSRPQVVKPRTAAATSVPGLLALFHDEWDALMLETAELRAALHERSKELATALYHHDASLRVIARLAAERDEARQAASSAPKRGADAAAAEPSKKAKTGELGAELPSAVAASMTDVAGELSRARRKRVQPEGLSSPEAVSSFAELAEESFPAHATATPGVLALAVAGSVIASGGRDKTVALFSRSSPEKGRAPLKGHTKQVTALAFLGAAAGAPLLSASADKTVRLWRSSGEGYASALTLSGHSQAVTALSAHPSQGFAASFSLDGTWGVWDLTVGSQLTSVGGSEKAGLTCGGFHPDGLIVASGCEDGSVKIWDVKTGIAAAKLDLPSGVSCLSFSENGYHLATGGGDGVAVWDLRKMKRVSSLFESKKIASLEFDFSGAYLAAGGAAGELWVVQAKGGGWGGLAEVAVAGGAKGEVAALRWGAEAGWAAVGMSGDHCVRLFGPQAAAMAE